MKSSIKQALIFAALIVGIYNLFIAEIRVNFYRKQTLEWQKMTVEIISIANQFKHQRDSIKTECENSIK